MLQSLLNTIKQFLGKGMDHSTQKFVKGGVLGNAWLQIVSMILVFVTQILIARIGGKEAYGTYSQVFNWIGILFIVAAFGSDLLLVKYIPIYQANKNNTGNKSILTWANVMVILFSGLVISFFAFLVNGFNINGLFNNATYFNYSLIGILFGALIIPQQSYLRGIKKVVLGQTADKLIKPIGLIIGILIFWGLGKSNEVESYVFANVIAFGIAFFFSFYFLFQNKETFSSTEKNKFEWNNWLSQSAWFTLSGLLFMLSMRLDVLAVGSFIDNVHVGFYNVALKYADLMAFPIFVVSHSIAPLYSNFYKEKKINEISF